MESKVFGKGHLLVEKYDKDGKFVGSAEAHNLWLVTGCDEVFGLITGLSANHFDNTNARIGIGDSTTAAADSQTDLVAATNKTYKAMDATYPTAPSAKSCVWRATFGASDANYDWEEFVLKHNGSGICINRGVQSLGTKANGAVWVATLTLSLA